MLRTAVAVTAGKIARRATRLRGGGSAYPGLLAERVAPDLLRTALSHLRYGIVVVSGTNGKTTTTKMLAAILGEHGLRVFSNPTGSNFTRGVISSMLGELPLSGRLDADIAVLELDEAHALKFAATVRPSIALLLNVARDQLDRFAEIDQTAALLAKLATMTSEGVVLNVDDSFVSRIAPQVPARVSLRYFGVDQSIAHRLPELQEQDARFTGSFDPPRQSAEDARLRPRDERHFDVLIGGEPIGPIQLRQRGLAAMINATAALSTARLVLGQGFDPAYAVRALESVTPPFGRGEVIEVDGTSLELVLVKNPAGFTVALSTYGSTPAAAMVAINDNYADGRDVSWLYDVSFESLREGGVAVTSGVRAYDMALRLHYEGVAVHGVEPDLGRALEQFLRAHRAQPKRIFCTYTAMMALRRTLAARYDLAGIGEDSR